MKLRLVSTIMLLLGTFAFADGFKSLQPGDAGYVPPTAEELKAEEARREMVRRIREEHERDKSAPAVQAVKYSTPVASNAIEIGSLENSDFKSVVTDVDLTKTLKSIPGLVTNNKIEFHTSSQTQVQLIKQWIETNPDIAERLKPDPSAYYMKNNKPIANKLERDFHDVFFNLFPRTEIFANLRKMGVEVGNYDLPGDPASTYAIQTSVRSKDGLLVISSLNVCVKNGHVDSRFIPNRPIMKDGCTGGQIYTMVKAHRLKLNPLCGAAKSLCRTPGEMGETVSVEQVYPKPAGELSAGAVVPVPTFQAK